MPCNELPEIPELPDYPRINVRKRLLTDDHDLYQRLMDANLCRQIGTNKSALNGAEWPIFGIEHEDEHGRIYIEFELI